MPAADLPINETARQRVLDSLNVLDSLPEAFSNAIATAAAAIANVPISAISLVDTDRQWFKSSCGLSVEQTPRDMSFCAHAILENEPFLVRDALQDPRFQDNPLVLGAPYIRFYAGFPLVVAGHPVGALCVIDNRPRWLNSEQIQQLTELAAGTAAWLAERDSLRSSLDKTKEELRYVTLNDRVTGLPNRLVFEDRLAQATVTVANFAVLLVDIDGLRTLREVRQDGHDDNNLREVGERLATVMGPRCTVASAGNDQFLILTEGQVCAEDAVKFADLIAMHLTLPIGHEDICVTASIGISLFPADGDAGNLVVSAHVAMLAAKQSGGDCYRFFEPRLELEARSRAALLDDLRASTRRGELRLHYQPKVHAQSGQITGAEALLRWRHPTRGEVSPAEFIPLAERAGLINEIGHWVISEATRQLGELLRAGIRMRVAINLSMHQLRQPTLADEIAAALARNEVDPALLTCEITESAAMDDAQSVLRVFRKLSAVGVLLSIDDFGTGYSSLSYLRKLPIHELKIDRSFITDLEDSEDARAVVAAIVNLAHALRLEVVAEGVETQAQRNLLCRMGCDKLQGFLFAKPMPVEALSHISAEHAFDDMEFRSSLFAETI